MSVTITPLVELLHHALLEYLVEGEAITDDFMRKLLA